MIKRPSSRIIISSFESVFLAYFISALLTTLFILCLIFIKEDTQNFKDLPDYLEIVLPSIIFAPIAGLIFAFPTIFVATILTALLKANDIKNIFTWLCAGAFCGFITFFPPFPYKVILGALAGFIIWYRYGAAEEKSAPHKQTNNKILVFLGSKTLIYSLIDLLFVYFICTYLAGLLTLLPDIISHEDFTDSPVSRITIAALLCLLGPTLLFPKVIPSIVIALPIIYLCKRKNIKNLLPWLLVGIVCCLASLPLLWNDITAYRFSIFIVSGIIVGLILYKRQSKFEPA